MVIFNGYVKLPEGRWEDRGCSRFNHGDIWWYMMGYYNGIMSGMSEWWGYGIEPSSWGSRGRSIKIFLDLTNKKWRFHGAAYGVVFPSPSWSVARKVADQFVGPPEKQEQRETVIGALPWVPPMGGPQISCPQYPSKNDLRMVGG